MRPLGEWLRQRREELGISLEQAEGDTRIRDHFLEALETEDLDALPNPVVARGFLRNYATYLELDPQEAIDRYAGITEPAEPEPLPVDGSSLFDSESFRPVPLHDMGYQRFRWWLPVGLIVVLLVTLAFLGWRNYSSISGWVSRIRTAAELIPTRQPTKAALTTATHTPAATAPSTATSVSVVPTQPTATSELTVTPTITPSPPPTPTEPVYTGIFLELVFTDTSWIQVTVDGVRQFQGELETGTYRSWYGRERLELRVGNAGAVAATVNGERLPPLGEPGDVVDRVFEIVDDQVAAATPTRAPTLAPAELTTTAEAPTPTPTITPTATITPTQPITVPATITPVSTSSLTAGPTSTSTSAPIIRTLGVVPTPLIHVVKLGDSLYNVSITYGTTVDAIKEANGLDSNNLRVGQELIIPVGTVTPLPTATTTPTATPAQP